MELVVPAPIGDDGVDRVRELAARVFDAIAGTGLARCDFFVRDDGEVLVNEINTIPGFTETSVFGKLFEASGIPTRSSATAWSSSRSSATARALLPSSNAAAERRSRCARRPFHELERRASATSRQLRESIVSECAAGSGSARSRVTASFAALALVPDALAIAHGTVWSFIAAP